MRRVMLVDDEPYIRKMLRSMGNWEAAGFTIAAEAINGEDALRQLDSAVQEIQLVFTDLRMPVMDGLALIEQAMARHPSLHFVVVSAYNDFALVRRAFLLGAEEYLLKSEMTARDIETILTAMNARMEEEIKSNKRHASVTETILQSFFEHAVDSDRIRIRGFPLWDDLPPLKGRQLICLAIRTPAIKGFSAASQIAAWIRDIGWMGVQLSRGTGERLLMLMIDEEILKRGMAMHLERLKSMLSEFHNTYVNIGISRPVISYEQIIAAAEECMAACDACFLRGNNHIIQYREEARAAVNLEIKRRSDALRAFLNALVPVQIDEAMHVLIPDSGKLSMKDIPQLRELFLRYHYILSDYAQQLPDKDAQKQFTEGKALIRSRADFQTLSQWLRGVIVTLYNQSASNSLIDKMRYYIQKNYQKDITLAMLAEEFHISPAYVSRLFTQENELSFVDYLSQIRIERAVELIRTTNMRLYEISRQVGFHGEEHFSRTFKRQMGVSPRQFVRKIKPEE